MCEKLAKDYGDHFKPTALLKRKLAERGETFYGQLRPLWRERNRRLKRPPTGQHRQAPSRACFRSWLGLLEAPCRLSAHPAAITLAYG